jgi:hypothetical protein
MFEEASATIERAAMPGAETVFLIVAEKRMAEAAPPREIEAVMTAVVASSSEMSKHLITPIVFRYGFDISFCVLDFKISIYLFYILFFCRQNHGR